jgi:hypothetical protein
MTSDSDESDDWATEALPCLPKTIQKRTGEDDKAPADEIFDDNNNGGIDDDEAWEIKRPAAIETETHHEQDSTKRNEGEPMILFDMTAYTEGKGPPSSCALIHSKFDAHSVNDPGAVRNLRAAIEREYSRYAKDAELLSLGIVIPCGSTVWQGALARLRQERPGHYLCPIFPPKTSA